jgi:hypothetical protein
MVIENGFQLPFEKFGFLDSDKKISITNVYFWKGGM